MEEFDLFHKRLNDAVRRRHPDNFDEYLLSTPESWLIYREWLAGLSTWNRQEAKSQLDFMIWEVEKGRKP